MFKRKNTIKFSAAIISILFMLSSCQSTKEEVSSDSYNQNTKIEVSNKTEITEENIESSEASESTDDTLKTFTSQDSKAQNTWAKNLLTLGNKNDYILMEDTSKAIVRGFVGLKESDLNFLLRVDSNLAGFGCSITGAYFIAQFDDVARAKIAKAAQQYFDDFENKKLSTKKNLAKNAYGSLNYKLNWGTFRSSTPNNGTGPAYLGYEFVKKQPYFIIWSYPIPNDYYEIAGDSTTRESSSVKFYFTRNQLKKLVEILSEENLENYYFSY